MRSVTMAIIGGAMAAVVACGDPISGDPVDISGDWVLYDVMSGRDVVCRDTLHIFFFQKKHDIQGTFTLSGACVPAVGDTATEAGSGVLGNGAATTEGISFHASNCFYEGTLAGRPAQRASGRVTCNARINEEPIRLAGTWDAHRQ